ncbi:carboxymuconolactone decarboxylase family protein [Noviherbaspirillum malthae]|jgi:4-carboxymuconolactone decarboxylase|uniref:carboxymuconolactone decarboxylase family protein n=1 Tax=Noviherbaspirillum malthae TaxID=1260987 RepID=UPI001E588152|nr:carboxymuconolactone decarboxylase family protein [Noviherbaspirillum malthae]
MTTAKPINLQDCMPGPERMPALPMDSMDAAQRAAAEALIAGPRGAVFGPFIPLMRSPELLNRLQKVGEYLRFDSVLDKRISEFVMLIVSRQWTQQFEWCMHYPLALKAGVRQEALDALAQGCRPAGMAADEEVAYDLCEELARNHGVCDATYARAVDAFGERGVVDLLGLAGYFTTVSMVMNVARTPPLADASAAPLAPFPR